MPGNRTPEHAFPRRTVGTRIQLRRGLCFVAACLLMGWNAAAFSSELLEGFADHCIKCHGVDKTKGGVDLLEIESAADLSRQPALMEKILEALRLGEMPPEDEKQPAASQRRAWIDALQILFHDSLRRRQGVTRIPIRRMNRFEYNNAVGDLFQLDVTVFALPERIVREYGDYFDPMSGKMPDTVTVGNRPLGKSQLIEPRLDGVAPFPKDHRAEHGFDNRGDHLSLSPLLLESFLALGQSIVNSRDFEAHCGIWDDFFAPPFDAGVEETVRHRLRGFLRRAFRGSVSADVVDRYTRHFMTLHGLGNSFSDSMKALASATLVSPRFLYIYTGSTAGETHEALSGYELASRLSFFLWSTIPDDILLGLAESGKLHGPEVLEREAVRMMNDRRMKNFCDSFPGQWLQLDQLIGAIPDRARFPSYYMLNDAFAKFRSGIHMMPEPLLLFETVFIEDRPIMELLDPDFSYRSDFLQRWYENPDTMKGVKAPPTKMAFKRVPIRDRRWGGVISNAAVLTMTSSPLRTKPVSRGAWLAAVIFNDPPDPPPADVPVLEEDDVKLEAGGLTLRQQLLAHQERQECAGCHRKIDPLGFALENYDAIGHWRDTYATGLPIDASGMLFNRHPFNSITEFKDAILKEKRIFARAFAGHLLAYALGRELNPGDALALDEIVDKAAADAYRLRTIMKAVVLSPVFRVKSSPEFARMSQNQE